MPQTTTAPDLAQIQGNVWPGFKKKHQAFLFLRFAGNAGDAHAWLDAIRSSITTAKQVEKFRKDHGLRRARRVGTRRRAVGRSTWINVAFSYSGIQTLLGVVGDHQDLQPFPNDFRNGMPERQPVALASQPPPPAWPVGGTPNEDADALVIIAADRVGDLRAALQRHDQARATHHLTKICALQGSQLKLGREPFGFRDGITQIRLDDTPAGGVAWEDAKAGDRVLSGEFILGPGRPRYARLEPGYTAPTYPAWAENGSYLVFRRLRQHVDEFDASVKQVADTLTQAYGHQISPALLKAKLVGRWPSGAKLNWASPLKWSDPAPSGSASGKHVDVQPADFAQDGDGLVCPLFAHIRKSNPRQLKDLLDRPDFHRLIRRGIPYVEPGGQDVGLLFVAYQASIGEQFEHIQNNWMNLLNFPDPDTRLPNEPGINASDPGIDPIVGTSGGAQVGRTIVYPGPNLSLPLVNGQPGNGQAGDGLHAESKLWKKEVQLDRFVTLTGGGYFFSPSIAGLAKLAGH